MISSQNHYVKISVITACLNAERTLEQTITSVLDQNYPNLEYIVIDGGSSDGTPEIIKKYADKLSRVVSEPDDGIYDAFNKGISMASGDIIGILNADDFHAPWALDTVNRAYGDNPNCDVFFGKVAAIDEEKNCWKVYSLGAASDLIDRMSIPHPATFLPKRTYDNWGLFDTRFKITGDWDYMLGMYLDGAAFKTIDTALTAFRLSGASSFLSRNHLRENKTVYKRHMNARTARRKIIKMYVKYCARRVMKATGTYDIYARFRDNTIFTLELSGIYAGNAVRMWNEIRAANEIDAAELLAP